MSGAARGGSSLGLPGLVALWLLGSPVAAADESVNPLGLEVHHVTAAVDDLDRAVRWYTAMLGFSVVERGVRQNGAFEFAELAIPGFGVALVHISTPTATPAPGGGTPAVRWLHVVFSVPDPDSVYRELKGKGADVWLRPPTPAGRIATFLMHDSEGNEIEIVGRPAAGRP